jgi:hypothetical protein
VTFNTDLAVEVLARIKIAQQAKEAEAELKGLPDWRQSVWGEFDPDTLGPNDDLLFDEENNRFVGVGTCGTAMCAAGHALTATGIRMLWVPEGDGMYGTEFTEDGRRVPMAAVQALGIPVPDGVDPDTGAVTDEEAWGEDDHWDYEGRWPLMFDGSNEYEDVLTEVCYYSGLTEDEVERRVQHAIDNPPKTSLLATVQR